ncbi:HAD-IIA family hydrolase [Clostridium sp. WLY-B-L2]|uniref:HAD-IIA family hydrolase n=1 Tax=Clostridium aromativorans TaxID=2836848 RepID=A0ABS8NAV0_9CLOT|nr:HAD-IIA family hydrolase [Clostridium aromativorans]MCC9296180.1 HAD-IIA family hydrolase [Clostridium aromativorans]
MAADEFDVFLFDLDGVIYIEGNPLPGAVECLELLRRNRKAIRFLTNNPCTTREKMVKRLNKIGIEAHSEEVITASWVTAQYLKKKNIKTVFVLGDENSKWECKQAGILIDDTMSAEAVVVGWDDKLRLRDIKKAVQLIDNGAKFIGTNNDRNFPGTEGLLPAVGAIVKAVEVASEKKPVIIGKPYPYMFKKALEDLKVPSRAVMIGDNSYSDILGAHQMGIQAILVSNKKTNSFPSARDFRNPDAVISNLKGLFDDNLAVKKWASPSFPWPNDGVKAGVAGIIFDRHKKVLLMKRADNGLWGIPSGHVEPGETVEEAIIREIMEETGLKVKVNRLIGVYSNPLSQVFSYPSGKIDHFITTCFECEVVEGNLIKSGEETLDVDYFDFYRLPKNLLPMHPMWLKDALQKEKVSYIR